MSDTFAVKYLHSGMRGAPVLNGQAGTLLAVLDALLVNGWGSATAASVTVASGVATAAFASTTEWEVGAVIEVSGATPGALNGPARVLSSTGNAITFTTAAPDGAATGTIAIKYASAGWGKPYTGSNMAAYRSQDMQSPRHYLRVRDSYGQYATVCGYETMTAISTGTGRFSRNANLDSNQSVWEKSLVADATPIPYLVAADSRAVLIAMACGASYGATYVTSNVRGFGDPIPLAPSGDAWCTMLSASVSGANSSADGALSGGAGVNDGSVVAARAASGVAGVQTLTPAPVAGNAGAASGADVTFGPAPSAANGAVLLSATRLALADGTTRAMVPGVYHVPQSGAAALFARGDVHSGAGELEGRRLYAVNVGASVYLTDGLAFVDLTGPWRP